MGVNDYVSLMQGVAHRVPFLWADALLQVLALTPEGERFANDAWVRHTYSRPLTHFHILSHLTQAYIHLYTSSSATRGVSCELWQGVCRVC